MSNGFCQTLIAALLLAASTHLSAQVYRCETGSGVVYSDLPCGESAEEIVIDVVEPASNTDAELQAEAQDAVPDQAQPASTPARAPARTAAQSGEEQSLNQFLEMLYNQREVQIGEIDRTLGTLRRQAESPGFNDLDANQKVELEAQIAELESSKTSILEEYQALIREAQSRLD